MWKIISLSALLFVAQAADIQDFYGDWIQVAFYPAADKIPVCLPYRFAKSPEKARCTFEDGINGTLVQVSLLTATGDIKDSLNLMVRVVDTLAEVMPVLNNNVKCGFGVSERAVARLVNEDYFILYGDIPPSKDSTRSTIEQNAAILYGRKVVSTDNLHNVMMSIEDLKNRRDGLMCGADNYDRFKSTENEVGN